MGILIIILMIMALIIFFCLEWRKYKEEHMPKPIIHGLVEKPIMRWYQTYTFSVRGQHFSIDADSLDEAWKQVRRLGLGEAFLISESAQNCELRYK